MGSQDGNTKVKNRELYNFIPMATAVFVIGIGCLVLVGWIFNLVAVQTVLPGLPKMVPNTAIGFVLAGMSLWLYSTAPEAASHNRPRRLVAQALAIVVVLIGTLTLSEYLLGWNPGFDQLLFTDPSGAQITSIPGRPSPQTTLAFTLVGISLLVVKTTDLRLHWFSQYLILIAAFIALLALLGYGFYISFLYRTSPYTGMALHTTVTMLVLCGGILYLHPTRGFMATITVNNLGGVMARRLLLAIIGVPLLVGSFISIGERAGLYGTGFGPVLLDVLSIYIYSVVIWWYANSLSQMDAARKEAEDRFRLVVEASPNGLILVDKAGQISLVNKRTEAIFGFGWEELVGKPVEMLVPSQFRTHHDDFRAGFFNAPSARPMGANRDLFGLCKDGSQVPVEIGLNPITTPEGNFVLASVIDITERKQVEEAVREGEKRFRALIENIGDMIAVSDAEGMLVYVSPSTHRVVGYTEVELLGRNAFELVHPENLEYATNLFTELVQRPGEAITTTLRILHKDGSARWVEATITNLLAEPSVKGVVGNYRDITERKLAEDALRQSEEKYRALYEEAPSAYYSVSPDGDILRANSYMVKMSGYALEDLIGLKAFDLYADTPAGKEKASKIFPQVHAGEEVRGEEIEWRTADGSSVWANLTVRPHQDAEGRFVESRVIAVDITDQKLAEQEGRRKDDLLQMTGEMARVGGWEFDAQTLEGTWTDEVARIHDLDPAQPTNVELGLSFYLPESREKIERAVNEAIEQAKPYELDLEIESAKGVRKWIRTRGLPITDGGKVIKVRGIFQDITEQKRAEEELAESFRREQTARVEAEAAQQHLAFLVKASATLASSLDYPKTLATVAHLAVPRIADWCAVDIVDTDGSVRRVAVVHTDPAKVELAYELQRRYPADLDAPRGVHHVLRTGQSELYPEISEALLKATGVNEEQLNLIHELGLKSAITVPILGRGGALGVITFVAAESDRRYNEADLTLAEELAARAALAIDNALLYQEAQTLNAELEQRVQERTVSLQAANKELESFSYSVSHDLRAPLRAIDGFSGILLEEYSLQLAPEMQRYLKLVKDNAGHMGELIDDLLTFSRLNRQPMQKQPVAQVELARQVWEDLQVQPDDRQVEITIGDLPPCEADPALLRQVWFNLLANALKYTSQREVAVIEVGGWKDDGEPVYFVKDNGVGFDMQYVDKLFGVFQRLHRAEEYEGTGVGLATVQRIIHRHGGRVWAEAEVDQGATFYFTL